MPWDAGEQLLCGRAVDARGAWRGCGRQWPEGDALAGDRGKGRGWRPWPGGCGCTGTVGAARLPMVPCRRQKRRKPPCGGLPCPCGAKFWSGRRDLNPRLQPWQGCTLPLSYSRPFGRHAERGEAAVPSCGGRATLFGGGLSTTRCSFPAFSETPFLDAGRITAPQAGRGSIPPHAPTQSMGEDVFLASSGHGCSSRPFRNSTPWGP